MKPTLTYCTNVHPGETLAEVEASLDRFTVPLKRKLAPTPFPLDRPFPVGLYMSAATARELAEPRRLAAFREFLEARGLAIVTLNCFPFGGFHDECVKLNVYRPTWLDERRAAFTLDAARALAQLVPEGAVAPISTVAGSCKRFGDGPDVHAAIARSLTRMAVELDRLLSDTGREIVLCLEPEPFSTLETTDEAVRFFNDAVFRGAGRDEAAVRRHVGLCFDTCHQAVEFEDMASSLSKIAAAGIRIGKMQLSSALELRPPLDDPQKLRALARYAEPRYLHQTFLRRRTSPAIAALDLPEFLSMQMSEIALSDCIRVHFHVPIHQEKLAPLWTTRALMTEAYQVARSRDLTGVFEVETYTFPVLPDGPGRDDNLIDALADELRFLSNI